MPKYSYGEESKGVSYEWLHIVESLGSAFVTDSFDYLSYISKYGRNAMQSQLQLKIKEFFPDIILFSMYKDEFDVAFLHQLSLLHNTFCFFVDDTWRHNYIAKYAPAFSAFSTTSFIGKEKYEEAGLGQAIYIPDGVNINLFTHQNKPRDIDISFIGSWSPLRQWILSQLKKKGISVMTFGPRWPGGIISEKSLIDILNRSKISLNLSNSVSWDFRYFIQYPRGFINTFRNPKTCQQIKGRHLEIPACGAMQISFYTPGLGTIFDIDKEIIVYNDINELAELIQFFLTHDERRKNIAQLGHQRTLKDHTYIKRFTLAFKELGWL